MTTPTGQVRWPANRVAQVIDLRENTKLTHREIGERVGATKKEVDQLVFKLIHEGRTEPRAGIAKPGNAGGEARSRTWEEVRSELRERYKSGEDHRSMALRLKLTRTQLQTQLRRLFREGMPKR